MRQADPRHCHPGALGGLRSSFFPEGVPIGRITEVDQDEGTVHVRPFADLRRLEFVQVLTEPAA